MESRLNRLDHVFQCVVESYIETAEPVGSRMVSKKYPGRLSPASIRNIMADLEEIGFLHQPHTSAGRVPTDKGYRYYVDSIMEWNQVGDIGIGNLDSFFEDRANIEDSAEKISRFLAELTGNAGLLYLKKVMRISYVGDLAHSKDSLFEHRDAECRLVVEGASRVIEQPEFRNAERIHALLCALESKEDIADLLERDLSDQRMHVHIGEEVPCERLSGISIVAKEYSLGGIPIGCVGVMGPTRMKYPWILPVVDSIADAITEFLNR